jgi:hypothetical protein
MPTTTNIAPDLDPDAIEDGTDTPSVPDREVIAPRYDARGRLLPIYRIWMKDGYTAMYHARTPGEACHFAIESARTMIHGDSLTARGKRLATTVDCWQQIS